MLYVCMYNKSDHDLWKVTVKRKPHQARHFCGRPERQLQVTKTQKAVTERTREYFKNKCFAVTFLLAYTVNVDTRVARFVLINFPKRGI
jgi:hypothetical protein